MADSVRIVHVSGGPISLDAKFDEDRVLRRLLPEGGTLDITGLATLDEAQRNPQLSALEQAQRIRMELASDDPTTRRNHLFIASAARAEIAVGLGPQPNAYGTLVVLEFTLDTDDAFRVIRIPSAFRGNATAHIHWTKSQSTDQSGKTVRWQLDYLVIDGRTQDGAASPQTVVFDATYDDAGTTTRIVYRTDDVPLSGLVAGQYLLVKVTAVTPPAGTPLVEPAMMTVDLLYDEEINR